MDITSLKIVTIGPCERHYHQKALRAAPLRAHENYITFLPKKQDNLGCRDISQTSVWGKQSVRLSAAAFALTLKGNGAEARTHFEKERKLYEKKKQDHHHPCVPG